MKSSRKNVPLFCETDDECSFRQTKGVVIGFPYGLGTSWY